MECCWQLSHMTILGHSWAYSSPLVLTAHTCEYLHQMLCKHVPLDGAHINLLQSLISFTLHLIVCCVCQYTKLRSWFSHELLPRKGFSPDKEGIFGSITTNSGVKPFFSVMGISESLPTQLEDTQKPAKLLVWGEGERGGDQRKQKLVCGHGTATSLLSVRIQKVKVAALCWNTTKELPTLVVWGWSTSWGFLLVRLLSEEYTHMA